MRNFSYQKAESVDAAISLIGQTAGAKFLGGGTNLVDLMRESIERPDAVVDVTQLPADIEETANGTIRIGAAMKNTALANHELIRENFPFLSQAILFGASGQIRNMATVGGNLLQRTRCYYFYDGTARCNKREPGAGCDALDGINRIHAILGTSDACIATHPSDMCVALAALDARVLVQGTNGSRTIAFNDFHRLPENTPHIETELREGELITAIEIPRNDFVKRSLYRKVRDRASYAFAVVSVAAALEVEDNQIKTVRLALGGVAHKPWRASAAESVLQGLPATEASFRRGAEAELANARGFAHNSFKIELVKRVMVSALMELAEQGGTNR